MQGLNMFRTDANELHCLNNDRKTVHNDDKMEKWILSNLKTEFSLKCTTLLWTVRKHKSIILAWDTEDKAKSMHLLCIVIRSSHYHENWRKRMELFAARKVSFFLTVCHTQSLSLSNPAQRLRVAANRRMWCEHTHPSYNRVIAHMRKVIIYRWLLCGNSVILQWRFKFLHLFRERLITAPNTYRIGLWSVIAMLALLQKNDFFLLFLLYCKHLCYTASNLCTFTLTFPCSHAQFPF